MERKISDLPERQVTNRSGLDNTGSFVSFAIERGLHLVIIGKMNASKGSEFMANLMMLADYLASDRTYSEVGRKFNISASDEISLTKIIQARLKRTLMRMYDRAPMYMRQMFGPFDEFSLRKPVSVRTRTRLSEAKGSIKFMVSPHLVERKSIRQICSITGLDSKQVGSVLYRERRGLRLEPSQRELNRRLVEGLSRPPRSSDARQKLLDQVTHGIFRKHRKFFVTLSEFFRMVDSKVPPHKAFSSVSEGVKWFGIPVKVISEDDSNRSIIFRRDANRIVKKLQMEDGDSGTGLAEFVKIA